MTKVHHIVRKPSIIIVGVPYEIARVLRPIKDCLDILTGATSKGNELQGLKPDASNEDVVEKINEIIARLNASGKANV